MSDTLENVGIAAFGLFLVSGLLTNRLEHAVARDLSRTMHGGSMRVWVEPAYPFGALTGHGRYARVTGKGMRFDSLPFVITPGGGLRGRVSRLDLDLTDVSIRGIAVRRFRVELPSVSLDTEAAMLRDRLVVRGAGQGDATAELSIDDLHRFVAQRYPDMADVEFRLEPGGALVTGRMPVMGIPMRFEARGRLEVAEGRFVRLGGITLLLNGKPAAATLTQTVAASLNPILDTERDLGLGDYLKLNEVVVGANSVTVRASARLPWKGSARPPAQTEQGLTK